eukprot:3428834-Pyramimonas_sp.AAC.1
MCGCVRPSAAFSCKDSAFDNFHCCANRATAVCSSICDEVAPSSPLRCHDVSTFVLVHFTDVFWGCVSVSFVLTLPVEPLTVFDLYVISVAPPRHFGCVYLLVATGIFGRHQEW